LTSGKYKGRYFTFSPVISMVSSHIFSFPGIVEVICAAVIGMSMIVAAVLE
jgi:hypothetical protein